MDEDFSSLTENVGIMSKSDGSINWIHISIGLFAATLIYFGLKYFVFAKQKTVSFDSDDVEYVVENQQSAVSENSHGVEDPKNMNYCEGDKCYL